MSQDKGPQTWLKIFESVNDHIALLFWQILRSSKSPAGMMLHKCWQNTVCPSQHQDFDIGSFLWRDWDDTTYLIKRHPSRQILPILPCPSQSVSYNKRFASSIGLNAAWRLICWSIFWQTKKIKHTLVDTIHGILSCNCPCSNQMSYRFSSWQSPWTSLPQSSVEIWERWLLGNGEGGGILPTIYVLRYLFL